MNAECTRYREQFSEHLDGRLGEAARRELEAHLAQCPACRAELWALERTVAALGELPARSAPEGFAERVTARIREREPASGRPRIVSLVLTRALPVAAMFLLVVGLTFVTHRNGLFPEPTGTAPAGGELRAEGVDQPGVDEIMQALPAGRGAAARPEAAPAMPVRMEERAREMADAINELETRMLKSMEAGVGGRAEDVFVFRQVARAPAQPQQVLSVQAGDVTDVLRQAVLVANRAGVRAELALHGEKGVDIFLMVPPERYDALLRRLALLTAPDRQTLSNTAIARDSFFELAASNYRRYQTLARDEPLYGPTNGRLGRTEATRAAFEKMGARAMMAETPAHPAEGADMAEVLPELRPAGPISLRIAIQPAAIE